MKMKQLIWIPALLVLVLNTGCLMKKESSTIHLAQFMTDPVLIEKLHAVVSDIEKRHPGLQIQIDNIPYNEYQQKLTTQLAGGDAPDVIYVEVNNFVDLYLRDVFEDLTPYVQKDGVDLKGYYPGVLTRFSPGGKVYALPQDTAPMGLVFYNRKMFRDAGLPYPDGSWTWPEPFLSICQKLTKKDAAGHVTQWAFIDANDIQYENFVFSNGGNWVDDTDHPTRLTLDEPKAMEGIQFRRDMIQKYHVSPDPSQIHAFNFSTGQMQMFMNGEAAMLCSGIWQTPGFLLAKNLDFDVAEFPAGPGGVKGWGTGGSGYAMSKSSKNKDLAWIVVKELASEASVSQLTTNGMIQPALIKLAQSDVFLKAPGAEHKAILLDMPNYSHFQPFISNWSEILFGELGPAMDKVWLGEKTVAEVVPAITKEINEKYFKK